MNGDAAAVEVRPTYEALVAENRRLKAQIQELTLLVEKLRRESKRPSRSVSQARRTGGRAEKAGPQVGPASWAACPSRRAATNRRNLRRAAAGKMPALRRSPGARNPPRAAISDEIPRTVIYRQFDVHVGVCGHCGHAVQGRHALQRPLSEADVIESLRGDGLDDAEIAWLLRSEKLISESDN